MEVLTSALLTGVGLAMLCFGGNWLVNGGVAIARKFRISSLVIGMTVVAYGTSTAELASSVAAALSQHSAIILGNVIGSNIANIGMVIAISAVIIPVAVNKPILRKEIPIMIGISFLLVLLSIDGEISEYDGAILLVSLGIFTFYTCRDILKHRNETKGATESNDGNGDNNVDDHYDSNNNVDDHYDSNNSSNNNNNNGKNIYLKPIGLLGLGLVLLYVGAILTVDNAVILAKEFGLSEKIIGLTVIAIGTSLPELITSIIAIKKGHSDIGIGNIIGSNIYNILMIMGLGAVLGSVAVTPDVYIDYTIMILFSLSLLIAIKTGVVNRMMGVCIAACYVAYLAVTFFK